MKLIWATRGRTWGFRFLRSGGLADPLEIYEVCFADLDSEAEGIRHLPDGSVALRILDPERRKDRAGRIIPHDFVILDHTGLEITSVEAARDVVWPEVADEYEAAWEASEPSSAARGL
ncbi:hypothetical protein [Citricoccus muralis]|uniref:Uncharacterized protein n=1 Tax=Citricoccus muralis TaxID=169134 RepID=A0ABY8H6G5_9MICC|nr:hypothetical protein [Citricoccus muralis]WFP16730.1 hypothetical protein P8192_00960 [Citricoccus muralis]